MLDKNKKEEEEKEEELYKEEKKEEKKTCPAKYEGDKFIWSIKEL